MSVTVVILDYSLREYPNATAFFIDDDTQCLNIAQIAPDDLSAPNPSGMVHALYPSGQWRRVYLTESEIRHPAPEPLYMQPNTSPLTGQPYIDPDKP